MSIEISPQQFQQYRQQWNQPVMDGDLVGLRQKTNAAYWVAYCYFFAQGGVDEQDLEQALQILEQSIQQQDRVDDNNNHDKTGKHRFLLIRLIITHNDPPIHTRIVATRQRANELVRQAVPRLEAEVQEGGNDLNFQEAAHYLGGYLFFGRGGVDIDPSRGIHWWKAAAELGHKESVGNLEAYCSKEPYIAEVFDWWMDMAGAEHGHAWAQKALGDCFRCGCGVEKDFVKAVEWYSKAVAQGYNRAVDEKQDLLDEMSPEEQSKTLGCVTRNQKIKMVEHLVEPPEPESVPLGVWADAIATLQHQEHPPWESPSPTFLALSRGITPQLQGESSNRKRTLASQD